MEIILDFLVNNYLWFLIISLILIFALIGYIVDTHEKKTPKLHFQENEEVDEGLENIEEPKTLKELLEENENKDNLNAEEINISKVNISEETQVNTKETDALNELPEK